MLAVRPVGQGPGQAHRASPAWSAGVVPTGEQLASALVTAEDYDGTWTVDVPPDAQEGATGVLAEEQQAMVPRIELCDRASEEARAAAEALRWQAFRQLAKGAREQADNEGPTRLSGTGWSGLLVGGQLP